MTNGVDRFVFARLQKLGIHPAPPSSDAVFLRRAHLDVTGTLPTAAAVRTFLADRDPDKRRTLIDRLLDAEEFADYWSMKWSDALRVKSEFPINLWPNAAQAYHRWIHASLRENVPYDRFARELLTSSGSNFRVPQVNFYRAVQNREPRGIAAAVALTFMGARAERWPAARLDAMSAFFSRVSYKPTREWKEEIVFFDITRLPAGPPSRAGEPFTFPDGTATRIAADADPRDAFAAWLTKPGNPWFARAAVNRIWFWLLGRGIVHEADDLRRDNPPADPELLAFLERELVAARYDLKHVYRLILNSSAYQLAAASTADAAGDARFAHYVVRPLDGEVLIDAICRLTGTTEPYSSATPEPFTFMPLDQRAVTLPDGSITSPFLETFGRPARDTGLASERSGKTTAAARLHLLNSSHIQQKLEQSPVLRALMQPRRGPRDVVAELYLMFLSRPPTAEEIATAERYARAPGMNPRMAVIDLSWALINSAEFLHRH